jgi:hypothetical protein
LKLKTSRICVVIRQRTCANVSEGESAPVNWTASLWRRAKLGGRGWRSKKERRIYRLISDLFLRVYKSLRKEFVFWFQIYADCDVFFAPLLH